MVILDSNHSESHVLKELEIYSELIKKGGYILHFRHGEREKWDEALYGFDNYELLYKIDQHSVLRRMLNRNISNVKKRGLNRNWQIINAISYNALWKLPKRFVGVPTSKMSLLDFCGLRLPAAKAVTLWLIFSMVIS